MDFNVVVVVVLAGDVVFESGQFSVSECCDHFWSSLLCLEKISRIALLVTKIKDSW